MNEHEPRVAGPCVDGGGTAETPVSPAADRQTSPPLTYRFEILRYDETRDEPPRFQAYEVTAGTGGLLLEALLKIQEEQDPSLAFRYACRGLVCGSCGMVVNGQPTLACKTRLADYPSRRLIIEPLCGFRVLKDLVVDMDPFWEKYARIEPWLHAEAQHAEGTRMSDQARERVDAFANCILCALCYAACPVVAMREEFAGPAALAKLHRFLADSRETRSLESLQGANRDSGVWGCRTATRCIDVCPKNVRPFDGIAGVRRHLALRTFCSLRPRRPHED